MSMQRLFATAIPDETRRVVEPFLPVDGVYRLVGDEVEQIIRKSAMAVECCSCDLSFSTESGIHYQASCDVDNHSGLC